MPSVRIPVPPAKSLTISRPLGKFPHCHIGDLRRHYWFGVRLYPCTRIDEIYRHVHVSTHLSHWQCVECGIDTGDGQHLL
jgi:hypothetical protein